MDSQPNVAPSKPDSTFDLFDPTSGIVPVDGEKVVRSYHATTLSSGLPVFRDAVEGFLAVTNARVIFHAYDAKKPGESRLLSEVPIKEVCGISSFKGRQWSVVALGVAAVSTLVVSWIAGIAFTVVLGVFQSVVTSSPSQIVVDGGLFVLHLLALALVAFVVVRGFRINTKDLSKALLIGMCPTLLTIGALLSSASTSNPFGFRSQNIFTVLGTALSALSALLGFVLVLYTLYCLFMYARRPVFVLSINAKNAASAVIAITGGPTISFGARGALGALVAEPAKDANRMLSELGALITDVQNLGTEGIAKWI
jgi:hypothetical protein